MSWPTFIDEPRVTFELSLSELKHIIGALIYQTGDPELDLQSMEMNAHMVDLLLQLETSMLYELNKQLDEDQRIREFGEP